MNFLLLLAQAPDASQVSSVEELSFGWLLVKTLIAMVFVLILAVGFIKYIMPRLQKNTISGKSTQIKMIDKFSLDMRKSLCLVQVGKKYFVISNSEQGLRLISEIEEKDLLGDQS